MPEQLELLIGPNSGSAHIQSSDLSVRISKRARRMFLHVRPPLGVELVVPAGTKPRIVEAFVRAHRGWIDAAHAEIAREYAADRSARPERVTLKCTGRDVSVAYVWMPRHRQRWSAGTSQLRLHCRRNDFSDAPELLRGWLLAEARQALPARLLEEARRVGTQPERVQVRLQRTRWGSCSARGTISVNASLLFLAPELARYLFVHELCHLMHMNHSRAYWRQVARYEPDYERLDAELALSWQRIPWWAVPRA
jgi:predicted metal-dependent hydrolase